MELAAQGRGEITVPGSIKKPCGCGTCIAVEHDSVGLMVGINILEIFSSFNGSMASVSPLLNHAVCNWGGGSKGQLL